MTNIINDSDLKILEEAIQYYKNESLKLKILINSAKTSTKSKYYSKKLKENNEVFSKYLYLYDKIKSK